jgi:crotonobetainyl-CoA:carnitine CoA-transferase CaiB-like acyl-CoA transferase
LQPIIEGWLANFDRDDVVDMLNTAGVPTGPVYNAEEVFNDPHVKARGMLMPIKDKDVGDTVFARTPIHLSKAPELPKNSAPNLGEDTEYVLSELLGYSSDKTQTLLSKGVVDKD